MMKTTAKVYPVRRTYNIDGVLESQTYGRRLRNITHEEMEHCVFNGGRQFFNDAMARHAKWGSNGWQHLFDKAVAPCAKGGAATSGQGMQHDEDVGEYCIILLGTVQHYLSVWRNTQLHQWNLFLKAATASPKCAFNKKKAATQKKTTMARYIADLD